MRRRPAYARPAVWALCGGVSLVVWLLNAGSEVIDVLTGDLDFPLWEPVVWELTSGLAIGLLAPFVIELALAVRPSTAGRLAAVAGHLGGAIAFTLLHVAGMVGLRHAIYALMGARYRFGHLGWELLYEGLKDVLTYALIVGLTYGVDYYRRFRERELQAARLSASLTQARLENLEHRIQPHFLFNTLNMISATMHEDVEVADRMIARLSDLLRMSTERRGRQEVPLHEELAMLEAYADIMRTRFERRLTVEISAEDDIRDALVPPLILQPLVENAIKYGIAERDDDGRIEVRATRNGTGLVLTVRDDGPGAPDAGPALLTKGLGLSTTVERLRRLYGDDHRFAVENAPGGGLRLTVAMPLRLAGHAGEPEPRP